jgi:hypothetical protein
MSDGNEIIDVEAVEIEDSDNLPAVIEHEASNSETIELPNRQDTLLADNPERRCAAHKRNGERCRKFAIMGSTVCRTHGGATKHVKNRARVRVENASDRLMGRLIQFAFDDTNPPDIQLRAMRDALDRAGLKPPAEVVLSQGQAKPYEELFDDIAGGSRAESRRARGVPDTQDDIAGVDQAHWQASSQEGTECQSSGPPTKPEPDDQTGPAATPLRRESRNPATAPRDFDRERDRQPPHRHICGDDAIRLANEANRQIGALKAIEGPHKRYPPP